jgi:hypothetical protein
MNLSGLYRVLTDHASFANLTLLIVDEHLKQSLRKIIPLTASGEQGLIEI